MVKSTDEWTAFNAQDAISRARNLRETRPLQRSSSKVYVSVVALAVATRDSAAKAGHGG